MPSSRVSNPTDLDQEKLQILLNQINLLSTKMDSVFKSRERMLSALEIRLALLASKMPGRPSSLIPNSCPVLSETTVPSIVKPDTKTTIVIYQSEDMVPSTPTDPFTPNVYTNPEILTHLSCFDTTDHSIVTPTCFLMRLYYKFFLFHFAPPWGRCCSFMLVLTFVLNNNQQAAYWTILFLSFPDSFLRLLCFEKDIFFVHFISCVFVYLTIQKKMNI